MVLFPLCSSFNVDSPHQQQKNNIPSRSLRRNPKVFRMSFSAFHPPGFHFSFPIISITQDSFSWLLKLWLFLQSFIIPSCLLVFGLGLNRKSYMRNMHCLSHFPPELTFFGFHLSFSSFVRSNSSSFPIFVTLLPRRTVSRGATPWNQKEICW